VKIIPVCPYSFGSNTYLLLSGSEAIVVDPSVSVRAIDALLEQNSARLCGILLTHGHFDHTVSVDTLRDAYPVPLMMHSGDAPMMTDGKINGFYDFYGKECTHRPAERLLEDGDTVSLGDEEIKVISTPGHSPGSICLLCHGDGEDFLISGDTLFSNSVGRWDLWQGNSEILARSLAYLKALDGNMRIYAGHGEDSTLVSALENAKYYLDF
jgi:glyoxylase-like metal-dependent hydrolase (beta-lactamase superfamily II)